MNGERKRTIRFRERHTFHLADKLKHKLFWWPETMLTYHLDFSLSADPVAADGLALFDLKTNEQIPYQLSNRRLDDTGRLLSADLSFMASLASGEERDFELRKTAPQPFVSPFALTRNDDSLWINTGIISAQIPASAIYPIQIPGPVMQMSANGANYGSSLIETGKLRIIEIVTECAEYGSVFAEFTVKYVFDGNKTYEATLRFVRNMEFVLLTERIENITEQDEAAFKLYWSGLAPTHRHAPNNPSVMKGSFDTRYEDFNWCKIDEKNAGGYNHPLGMWSNKEDGQIPFRLSVYEPQAAVVKVNAATFWNENTGRSIGTFIADEAEWDNGRYDLFCSWDGFAVSFYYKNGLLWWRYPLISGKRTTAIAMYEHTKDRQYFDSVRPGQETENKYLAGGTRQQLHGASYVTFLQNRYSLLSLNRVKEFVLDYPENAKRSEIIFDECPYESYEAFEDFLMNYTLISRLPTHGQRENAGFHPVPYRRMTGFAAAYSRFKDEMPEDDRKRIEAMLLLLTYLAAGEHVVPLRHMYGGPPNLQGDVRRALAYMATQFPEHPDTDDWKETFSKFVETSLRLFTRPELTKLRLKGGRWAENIGTYTWAFLIPALKAAMLLEKHNGHRNVFASRYSAALGEWLVHSMTAPFNGENGKSVELMKGDNHHWGCFAEGQGPHRVFLPIGAHAARRTPPASMRDFARRLERYDPILAENIHYVCSNLEDDFEKRSRGGAEIKPLTEEERLVRGTRPAFATTAFTGFGIMLRSGVYTSSEVSVFVQQIDEGPNYRWGTPGAGGSGNIYYYANGRAYSHNGKEDAGDRKINDCEVGCTFGVWKNNKYTAIGPNVITNAYHALGTFQYTAIEPEKDDKSYSYPEYMERNVLLSGTDYISIYDKTGTPAIRNRFTWSVHSYDRMPFITMVTDYEYASKLTTGGKTSRIDSVWYEGSGSCFAIVSHREDLRVEKRVYGAIVSSERFKDTLFRNHSTLKGEFDGFEFDGTAGAVREYDNGAIDVALIQGRSISAKGIRLQSEIGRTGLCLRITGEGELIGRMSSLSDDRIAVSCEGKSDARLYVNSALCKPDADGLYAVPEGEYTLELVAEGGRPIPAQPVIRNIVQGDGSMEVRFDSASAAERYIVEISSDYCQTWSAAGETSELCCKVDELVNGLKYFVRVCGVNEGRSGPYSHEYPAYPSKAMPLSPEGLDIVVRGDELHFSWGSVLGAAEYRLYRRDANGAVHLLYVGQKTEFSGARAGSGVISSYAVAAVNMNGEGERSAFETNDDPASLRNDKPLIDMPFNRNSHYNHHPFKLQNAHKYREVPSSYPPSVR